MRRPFHPLTTAALIGALAGLAHVSGCQAQPKDTQAADWDTFVQRFVEAYYAAHPGFAVQAGRHEFDGRLPDWRPAALKEEAERLRAERRRAMRFRAASLDGDQRFERDYLLSVIDRDLFWLESARWPHRNPMFYAEALDPNVYLTRAYAPLAQRLRAYSAYARAISAAAKQIRANLRAPLPRTYIDVGQIVFGGLATYYEKDVPGVFGSVDDAPLQAEFRAANKRAIQAMKDLVRWLDEQRAQATEGFALGTVLFRRMLGETEGIDVPLEDLERVGREDLRRNLVALRDACAHYAPGKPIEACIAKAQAAKPKGGAIEGAGRQLPELKAFLIAKDLVTVPGAEEARVARSPPYKRWNLAYIDIPGPHEQGLPAIYYVAPPDPMWSKAERETYVPATADLLFISVHEVWPGHFLQSQHARRSPSPFRQLFSSYAFTEGWAHSRSTSGRIRPSAVV